MAIDLNGRILSSLINDFCHIFVPDNIVTMFVKRIKTQLSQLKVRFRAFVLIST